MHTSAGTTRSSSAHAGEIRRQIWPALIVTLVAGLVGAHLIVVKPLKRRMEDLERELAAVERDMRELVGVRDRAVAASTLLAELKEQGNRLGDASRALRTIRRFRTDLENEAAEAERGFVLLDRLGRIQQALLAEEPRIVAVGQVVHRIAGLHARLLDQGCTADEADEALSGMIDLKSRATAELADMAFADVGLQALSQIKRQLVAESADVYDAQVSLDELMLLKKDLLRGSGVAVARENARRLAALRDELAAQGDGLPAAERHLAQFARLKSQINTDGPGADTACRIADDLLSLKDEVVLRGSNTETARHNVRRLVSIRDELNVDPAGMQAAERNLSLLLGMRSRLADRSDDLVGAVQSLELLLDFRDEVDAHLRSLDGVRRNLMEIALLENSVLRAARVLQPLAELANLRRLGDAELRQAARSILEQRASRLSRADEELPGAASGLPASVERGSLVPDPIDED